MKYRKNIPAEFPRFKEQEKGKAEKEIKEMRSAVEYHNRKYYKENKPVISDADYDRLFKRLKELEEKFPRYGSGTSPARRVGAPPSGAFKKVKHASPMLSLESVLDRKDAENIFSGMKRNGGDELEKLSFEPKYDGLSVEIIYKKGKFSSGSTRGDGIQGEDITHNLKMLRGIKQSLVKKPPSFLSVRGEIYMSRKGFTKVNKERVNKGMEPFANPRNAAAGIMRQLDPDAVKGMPLNIVFYEILSQKGLGADTHMQSLKQLSSMGLQTGRHNKTGENFSEAEDYRNYMASMRDEMDYEIDGVVVKADAYTAREKLGVKEREPKWAFAWKFEPKKEITRVEDIAVSVGRTGILTPVALLSPVDIGGVTISRATLHNEGETRKKDIRPGDTVRVQRAGDVIPEITGRKGGHKKSPEKFSMPSKCPSCGARIIKEGAYHMCPAGLSCRAQLGGRIIHYASRSAVNISGLGDETVKQIVGREMVKDLPGIYELKTGGLKKLEGFSDKSAEKLYNSIQNSKEPPADRFLYALGIRHVGIHAARSVMREFGSIDKVMEADKKEFDKIRDIGGETAGSLYDFFRTKENVRTVKKLFKCGVKPEKKSKERKKNEFTGKTVVFTGSLKDFSRDEAKEIVEESGGHASSSVSGQTDFVVAGKDTGSKLQEAKKHGVKIIKEEQFKKMFDKGE
ncbi:MAG: NAD-dependent DNA ligase LigA [Candidatus Goldiibacteriota bacterium]